MSGSALSKRRSLHAILQAEFLLVGVVICIGMIAFHLLEGWRRLDAFYFTVITISGVGYGDITPDTDVGKILAAIFASVALPLYVFTTSILITKGMELLKKKESVTRSQRIITHYAILVINPYNQLLVTPTLQNGEMTWLLPSQMLSYGTDPEAYCLGTLVQRLGIRTHAPQRFGVRSLVDMKAAQHHVHNIYRLRIHRESDSIVSWEKEHLTKAYQRIALDDIRNERDDLIDESFRIWLKESKEQIINLPK